MEKLIEFRNIVKSFDGQTVLKGINLDIYENEFVTLLGPSGCGKTTLLGSWAVFWIKTRVQSFLTGKRFRTYLPISVLSIRSSRSTLYFLI